MPTAQPIAVIDDDEGSRLSIVALLRSLGLGARAYPSAASYLADPVPAEARGAVVSDIQMPGMDGFQLLAALRGRAHRPFVVLMTAHPIPDIRRLALEAGADRFFAKPVDGEALVRCLTKATDPNP